jgi:anti-anti-sigma regulatory factor
VPVTLEQNEVVCLVRLEGAINIDSAAELKAALLEARRRGNGHRLHLERATELDATAWQLLWAAGHGAAGSGVEFTLAGRVPKEIAIAANEAGFESFPVGASPE